MKKTFCVFIFVFVFLASLFSNLSVSGTYIKLSNPNGVNDVYLFNGFSGFQLSYEAQEEKNFVWKKYTNNPSAATEVQSEVGFSTVFLNVEDATGYILEIDGTPLYHLWFFDYTQHQPIFHSFNLLDENCDETRLVASVEIPAMEYYSSTGVKRTISRDFSLKYQTLVWNETESVFKEEEKTLTRTQNETTEDLVFSLDNVYANTDFVLSGDQYASQFSLQNKIEYSDYSAIKPIVKAEGVLTPRTDKWERDRGSESERRNLEGSAPMEVSLNAYANTPLVRDFTWYIYNELTPDAYGYYREQSFQYKFSAYGNYVARVVVTTDGGCVAKDSIKIKVAESALEVPNVFTPNGDGANDEFCVAFKSLIKFNIWIYNRWGRLVFSSNSASNCWDGYIGNTKAATGAYFYVIEAKGSDGKEYKKSGDINLLRGRE